MSTFGRRGSRETGWDWFRPPPARGRPPPPPLLPLAGAALLFAAIAAALLAVSLSGSGTVTPPPTATPAATARPTATAAPSPPPSPTPTPTPTPSPTPTPTPEPGFSLAVWDGEAWQFESDGLRPKTFREGQAVPFMLRFAGASPGERYPITLRYSCRTFDFMTTFDRDRQSSLLTLAAGGPGRLVPDATIAIPDDPGTPADDGEASAFSLWGGSFARADPLSPAVGCVFEKTTNLLLTAAEDGLYLMWAAQLSSTAADGSYPIRLAVRAGGEDLQIEIAPSSVAEENP